MKTLLENAVAKLGVREDHNNPLVLKFFAEAGHPEIRSTSVAWCAGFVGAMLFESGYKNTGSLAARSYEKYGTKLDAPVPSCIAVFPRAGSPTLGHVGIVEKVLGQDIQIISGNDNDSVRRSLRKISSAIAFRMPIKSTDATRAVQPKSILKSKIVRIGAGAATLEAGDAVNTAIDVVNKVGDARDAASHAGILDHVHNLVINPRFVIAVVVVIAVAAIIYWRWKDHQ